MDRLSQDNEAFVAAAYRLLLLRAPDANGRLAALAALSNGTSRADWLTTMLQSEEFQARLNGAHPETPTDPGFAARLSDTRFVQAAYRELLKREPDTGGLESSTSRLSHGESRHNILHTIVDSTEFENRLLASTSSPPLPSLINMRPNRYRRSGDFLGFIVETELDYDWLEAMILEHGYYERPGPWGYGFDHDKKNLAELISLLNPHRVLEVGCGDGSTLHGLTALGIDCIGLDLSSYARERALEDVRDRIFVGDLLNKAGTFKGIDTICGFDVFEHLNPNKLPSYLCASADVLSEDGLMLINVPAFGDDDLFGDAMGVWTDEWRKDLKDHTPFSFIPCDDKGFPLMGHLVWADSVWWERLFNASGFVRLRAVEKELHRIYDPIFEYSHARRAFLLFGKRANGQRPREIGAKIRAL